MSGLASNLCVLGMMYVTGVLIYAIRSVCIKAQDEEQRWYR